MAATLISSRYGGVNVYFGGKVDIALTLLECPLMTQSGHRTAKTLRKRSGVQLSVELTPSTAGGPGCSTETGSDAGKVFFRASSSAFSRRQYSRLPRSFSAIISIASIASMKSELIPCRLGVKRTCLFALQMSAYDPKRTRHTLEMNRGEIGQQSLHVIFCANSPDESGIDGAVLKCRHLTTVDGLYHRPKPGGEAVAASSRNAYTKTTKTTDFGGDSKKPTGRK